jgi:hypothetical protein
MTIISKLVLIVCVAFILSMTATPARAQYTSLGTPSNETFVGEPSCLSWPATNTWIQCYVRGASGTLWRINSMDGVTFESGWTPLGGAMFSDPICVSPTWPQVQCFATFRDQALWRRTSGDAGRTWSDWQEVRADIRGRPSCVSPSAAIVDCFGIASDLNVYRIRMSGSSNSVTPVGVASPGGGGGDFAFSLGPAFVSPFVMTGPECVLRRDASGATLNTLCFGRKSNGSMWTATLGTNPAGDPVAQWTRVTGLASGEAALQCFDRPGGRVDCFGSSGSVARHFSNIQLPGTTASGGFFFEPLSTQGHIAPIRCLPAPGAANIECLIVSWPAQSLPASAPFDLWRFTHDGNTNTWSSQNLGADVRGAPSCLHWAYRPTSATLAVGDIQCFAVGGAGDLVHRRLNPPHQVDVLRPPLGGEGIRRCRPGTPGCQ